MTSEATCPACGMAATIVTVPSVNAGRRPALREAILERSYLRDRCAGCAREFRLEPEFSYLDLPRRQFFLVLPRAQAAQWKVGEARATSLFATAFGPEAAASLGTPRLRLVCGWAALSEKLVADDLGVDDLTLELAKLGVIRETADGRVAGAYELRLLGMTGDDLHLGWIPDGAEAPEDVLGVPKALIGEIEAAPEPWKELRDELSAGPFVDLRRSFIGM